jgi:hypothetical protein
MEARARDYSKFIDPLGLNLPEYERLDAADIAAILELGSGMKSSAAWLIGDCVNLARRTQNDEWMNYLSNRVELRTCNNYASIAGKFNRERRHANLSFSHHDAVKALPEAEQDYWLDRAEKEQLGRDDLRQMVKDVAQVEKRTVIGHVGSIDKLLTLDFGLPSGFEVKISYEVVLAAA